MFIDVVVKYLPQRSYKFEGRNRLESRNLTIKGKTMCGPVFVHWHWMPLWRLLCPNLDHSHDHRFMWWSTDLVCKSRFKMMMSFFYLKSADNNSLIEGKSS